MAQEGWRAALEMLSSCCAAGGVDLAAAGRVGAYNALVGQEHRLPDFGDDGSLVVVLANSRALWPHLLAALDQQPGSPAQHPLDCYVEEVVRGAVQRLAHHYELRFAHDPPPRRVAMQRLAEVAGLATLSPAHLSVHPRFGPWIGLRAAVVIDCEGPEVTPHRSPCEGCAAPCASALGEALEAGADSERDWPQWVAIRDACPLGREHRYEDAQLRYHYTKDRRWLRPAP